MPILHSFNKRLRWLHFGLRSLSPRDLLPLAVALPIITYAYLFQAVVTSKGLEHQAQTRQQDMAYLSNHVDSLSESVATVCRDYAHWSDTYQIVQDRNTAETWFKLNFEQGIAGNFGYGIIVLQNAAGNNVWVSGYNRSVRRALVKGKLLGNCLNGTESSGVISIGGAAYVYAAIPVLRGDHTGAPHGMLFAASKLDAKALGQIYQGRANKCAFVYSSGRVILPNNLGTTDNMPPTLIKLLQHNGIPSKAVVEPSRDGMLSYGLLPIIDTAGKPVGTMVDIESCATLVENLRAIRHMSAILSIICALFGAVCTIYVRNRHFAISAHQDELTGLHNHRYLQECLRNELQRAERYTRPLSVLMVDIDHFKVVNDTYGHSVGDQALKAVADVLMETVRDMDVVARYGGEEFVVVLPEAELAEATACAQRLRRAVQAKAIAARTTDGGVASSIALQMTISIGIATHPDDGQSAADLINSADTALSGAKRTRNTVFAYREIVDDQSSDSDSLASLGGFLRDSSMSSVRPLVASIDTRDPGSAHHSEKTAEYAVAIGLELGFTTQELSLVCKAALLHDVGKIGVPDYILTKHGRLTEEELEIIRRHPNTGSDILSKSPLLAPVAEIVLHHHERYDGAGYPDGLAGDQIPLVSRVLSVADTLDAMTSQRSYHKPVPMDDAAIELQQQVGKQFDPVVVEAAVIVIDRISKHTRIERDAA